MIIVQKLPHQLVYDSNYNIAIIRITEVIIVVRDCRFDSAE